MALPLCSYTRLGTAMDGLSDHFLSANLNLNGTETQTETGPLFMYAGVKRNCFAASTAGSLKISASLLRMTTCFGLPSLSTQIFTQTFPSRPARMASSGYL